MKTLLVGVFACLLAGVVIIWFFGARINTSFACTQATGWLEAEKGSFPEAARTMYMQQLNKITYSWTLAQAFSHVARQANSLRHQELRVELQRIMGDGYTCPALEEVFGG